MTKEELLKPVMTALTEKRVQDALTAAEKAVEAHPEDPDALALQGVALLMAGRPNYAIPVMEKSLELRPSKQVHLRLAQARELLGDAIGGLKDREAAASIGEAGAKELYDLGHAQEATHRFSAARETFDKLLGFGKTVPEFAQASARLARIGGDRKTAVTLLNAALKEHPEEPRLLADRINLGQRVTKKAVATAEKRLKDETVIPALRRRLAFALAGHFDRTGDEEQAWHYAETGNALYDKPGQPLEQTRAEIDRAFALYDTVEALPAGDDAKQVYLIGSPRSGGTLLQSLLSAPDGHASLGERGALLAWLFSANPEVWEAQAQAVQAADLRGMHALFPEANVFLDKTTHHAHVAGLVAKMHPDAVFVEQRRDPRDVLVSIFMHPFNEVFGYTRRAEDIARYLVVQRETVDRWRETGLRIEAFDHDAFLEDPASQANDLFGRLGFDWDESYLTTARNVPDVRTFSIDQVREEIAPPEASRYGRYKDFVGELPDEFASITG